MVDVEGVGRLALAVWFDASGDRLDTLTVLGTGGRQVFPPAAVLAACLSRGIGIEVMANAAAARTFHVLAGEGRKVVAAMLLAP